MPRAYPFLYITGGCRSGKSAFAQRAAEFFAPARLFLATARADDDEMRERVRRHQAQRGADWRLYELKTADAPDLWRMLPGIIREGEALLFDCLTLWTASMMPEHGIPQDFEDQCERLTSALYGLPCPVVVVNNEVGMGVVPPAPSGRAFRDMAGVAGQAAARAATDAVFMASGLPLALKGRTPALPGCGDIFTTDWRFGA